MKKRPFQDALGRWWCYRSDDRRKTPSPLGPFFTQGYARDCTKLAMDENLPMPSPLSHQQPVHKPGAFGARP